ncbi:MAG: hypothetical protein CL869_00905 [Cytophagia bacterium]|nr:hypothetical protein [Cytophagia bacterium]
MRNKIKVAILIDSEKKSGGQFHEIVTNARNIQKEKAENFEFIIIYTSKSIAKNLPNLGIEKKYFNLNKIDRYLCYLRNYHHFFRRIKNLFFRNKFENFLKNNNVDLVYFIGPSQYSLYLENTKFIINIPDIYSKEHLEIPEFVNDSEYQRKDEIFRLSFPRAIGIIVPAEIVKRRISFFYGVLEKRIQVINHQPSMGINEIKAEALEKSTSSLKEYKLPKNYLFYPAMYAPHKNHKTLIDALEILNIKFKLDFSLVLCGNDLGYLKSIKSYTKKKNLEKKILFLNFVKDEHLPFLYKSSFALLMPVLSGPSNIPPWEAFKLKVPVIYSNLDGVKEVFDDAVCYVDPFNAEDMAQSVKKLYENKNFREELILKGQKKLQEVQSKNEIKKFFKIINDYRKIKNLWDL